MSEAVRTIGRDLGRILQALAGLVFVSISVSIVWGEFYAVPALIVSGLVPGIVGGVLASRFRDATQPGKLHAMIIAALGWFSVALFGALPFLLIAWTVELDPAVLSVPDGADTATLGAFTQPLNAFFESMSGFTGTGLTMTDNEEVLPRSLQWWRTFSEWIGGVGVIVLTTAILARPGSGSLTLYESEARSEKIHPSIVSTVRTIWWIFILFTFLAIILLWLAGRSADMTLWQAINHGMTGLSTGGFSVTDNSIATHDSAVVDFVLLPIMIAGSIAFPVHYLILNGELRNFYADLQTRWVFIYMTAGTVLLTGLLYHAGEYDSLFRTFRYGSFQFVSAATCAGFQTAVGETAQTPAYNVALGNWPTIAQLTVSAGMVIGGAAGSTVGGIKLVRVLTLFEAVQYRISDVFYPDSAVRRIDIDGRQLTEAELSRELDEAAIIALLWVLFLGLGAFVLLFALGGEFDLEHVLFEVASAQGNVGLSAGITGPDMPTAGKVMFLFTMWIGRLEIIPVLVTLRALFDRGGLYR
jgi:trk system potassium uptake protein TrkH